MTSAMKTFTVLALDVDHALLSRSLLSAVKLIKHSLAVYIAFIIMSARSIGTFGKASQTDRDDRKNMDVVHKV